MTEREGGRPRPRIQPKMNTDTRRHDEKSAYRRRGKYREDPLDTIEPEIEEQDDPERDDAPMDAQDDDEDEDDDANDPGEPGR